MVQPLKDLEAEPLRPGQIRYKWTCTACGRVNKSRVWREHLGKRVSSSCNNPECGQIGVRLLKLPEPRKTSE